MYWTGSHTKHRHMYHIVWIPKYRKRVLRDNIALRVKELLEECAETNRWEIHELNVQPDHIHLLVQLHPNISVSKAVQFFKVGSSKKLREEFSELQEFCGEIVFGQMDIFLKLSERSMWRSFESI